MAWVVRLEEVIDGKVVRRAKVATVDRSVRLDSLDDLGLRQADAKPLLASIQSEIVSRQIERDAQSRVACPDCGKPRRIKNYRARHFDTLFGRIEVRIPRIVCPEHGVGGARTGSVAGPNGRSTPEYDAVRARLSAQLPYRAAAALLADLLPVGAGAAHTTLRNRSFAVAEKISSDSARATTDPPVEALTLQLDHAYVRATASEPTRHLAVLAGAIQSDCGGHIRRFASLAEHRVCPSVVRGQLECSGYRQSTALMVLTDGDEGLRNIARAASSGNVEVILDWFHLAMRLRPIEQLAQGLRARIPTPVSAKSQIIDALEHLHWRLWHGKLATLEECFGQIRAAVRAFRRYNNGQRLRGLARTLMTRLQELTAYISGNVGTLVNYHRRHHAGLRVSSCGAESTVNYLINRRMNKSQQMRWSRQGAELHLRVRAALLNDEFDALANDLPLRKAANEDVFSILPLAA